MPELSNLMLLGGTLLLRLPDDVNLYRLRLQRLCSFRFLVLFAAPAQGELVLSDADEGGSTPEKQHSSGRAPRDPQHEQRHDYSHDQGLVALLVLLVLHLLDHHRKEGGPCEDDHQDQVGKECQEAFPEGPRRGLGEVGNYPVEGEGSVGRGVVLYVAEHLEEGDEDRHLQKHGKASHEGVELRLGVKLLHLLVHADLVVAVLLLDLLDLRLYLLHLEVGLRLLVHQRCHQYSEYDGDDDDGHAPVAAEAVKVVDDFKDSLKNYFPHTLVSPSMTKPEGTGSPLVPFSGTGSYPYGPPGLHLEILLVVRRNPLKKPNLLNASNPYSEQVG